jgi:predicted DNA-binding protein
MNYITKNKPNKTIINFRVSPEVKQTLEKLAEELCTNKTNTLRFMIEYFSEMKTGEVLVRKHTLEVQNLRKRLRKQNAELDRITSRIEKGEKLAVDEVQSLA